MSNYEKLHNVKLNKNCITIKNNFKCGKPNTAVPKTHERENMCCQQYHKRYYNHGFNIAQAILTNEFVSSV